MKLLKRHRAKLEASWKLGPRNSKVARPTVAKMSPHASSYLRTTTKEVSDGLATMKALRETLTRGKIHADADADAVTLQEKLSDLALEATRCASLIHRYTHSERTEKTFDDEPRKRIVHVKERTFDDEPRKRILNIPKDTSEPRKAIIHIPKDTPPLPLSPLRPLGPSPLILPVHLSPEAKPSKPAVVVGYKKTFPSH